MSSREGAREAAAGRLKTPGRGAAFKLRLTVIFTTAEGTAAALRTAARLARGLEASVWLLVPEVVPHGLPIGCPPVALEHTRQTALALVSGFVAQGDDVRIEICLCRSRRECIAGAVSPQSVILVGGRARWWPRPERRLERSLRALGHEVIFVEQ